MALEFLNDDLEALRASHLFRECQVVERVSPTHARVAGRDCTLFCSNDYLGLAAHPKLAQAAQDVIARYGWGAGAARLISGTSPLHAELESELARFEDVEAAIVFPTGYMANLGAIAALVGPGDLIISDRLNHASIIDACRLSRAQFRVYPHADVAALGRILIRHPKSKALVVTDGVFSMDGDLAPLKEIVRLKSRHGFLLMVDEAHGTGVFGKHGRGAAEHLGVEEAVDIRMGTLSKAVGSIGGFVAGRRSLIEFLVNKARSFIYSTALPPAACAASLAGLRLIREAPALRERLWRNVSLVRTGLEKIGISLHPVPSPIIPVMVGEAKQAVHLSKALLERRVFIPAVRPPAVPKGASRLRITVSAAHSPEEIEDLCNALGDCLRRSAT